PVTKPIILINNFKVQNRVSVFLTCSSNDTGISIRWIFNGQNLRITRRMKLLLNNKTLSIDPVRRADSGKYRCVASNLASFKWSDPIQLDIIADPAQESSGLSGGAIAGIIIGSVAGVTLIAALAYFFVSRRNRTGSQGTRKKERKVRESKEQQEDAGHMSH
ncbi:hypothetical protein U0070_005226, partial [Myodes glareolus]